MFCKHLIIIHIIITAYNAAVRQLYINLSSGNTLQNQGSQSTNSQISLTCRGKELWVMKETLKLVQTSFPQRSS